MLFLLVIPAQAGSLLLLLLLLVWNEKQERFPPARE
jgi:hypothetical protein